MATCPQGHPSGDDEYCDTCGIQMTGAPQAAPPPPPAEEATAEACPICRTPRAGQFCEVCGHDYSSDGSAAQRGHPSPHSGHGSAIGQGTGASISAPVTGARWEAVTAADRAYYEKVIAEGGPDADAVAFPPYCPERSFGLVGEQVRIGRRSRARNTTPEIDLTGPPEDPGVSHLHAVLLAQPDGTYMLVDPGSANGTQVNGRPVKVNVPVRVGPGDRIHLGAWTVITIREGTP
ncbi:FHA domain-containing protein [Nonomuraea solani]|uniref:FHA domain-containing protein n=1 Tax=Nonomuraea solani TaxID=1144553 RepID=A0A1H5UHB7_9ACTN|nr:FHA domain-containing protein [Nonomuraea solani]SEF73781.1 FHA domain-containing protein [Nonomuraea solani]